MNGRNMTYRELAEKIGRMSDEEKDCDVSVHSVIEDEYFSISDQVSFINEDESDVMDDGHPYLKMKMEG